MIFAEIVAGGIGSRMAKDIPKQYININGKPIIIHTIEKFYNIEEIDKIAVLCPKDWIDYTKDLINKYISDSSKITVLEGGSSRNETMMNGIKYFKTLSEDKRDILITHDAVRPFVTKEIIEKNIEMARKVDACDTVIPATDTIVKSEDGMIIDDVPDRSSLYHSQTPQTFDMQKLMDYYYNIDEKYYDKITDGAAIFRYNNDKVYLVQGDGRNIKVTYPYDLILAEAILKSEE